jgi:hypothetical protein
VAGDIKLGDDRIVHVVLQLLLRDAVVVLRVEQLGPAGDVALGLLLGVAAFGRSRRPLALFALIWHVGWKM